MIIKDEIINVEITFEELASILMPNLYKVGFQVIEVNEGEIKMIINDLGDIKTENGIIMKFKRARK